MPEPFQGKPSTRKIPLQIVLVIPFVGLTILAVALVGYISFYNGQRAVNNVAHQLRGEITARIEEHLLTFLDTPHQINQSNASAIAHGVLDANKQDVLQHRFWNQIQVFKSVSSIYFGNTAGGLADAGREGADGSLYVIITDDFSSGSFRKYATDNQGNLVNLLTTVPNFDARTRPWYTRAVAQRDGVWSDVYILFTGQDMAISASHPVYDDQQRLLGVTAVDLFLSDLGSFLSGLDIGYTGQSFIMEPSGLLIATSTGEQPFTAATGDTSPQRLAAANSQSPLTRAAATALTDQFGDYQAISSPQQFEFYLDGQRQLGQVAPLQDQYGLSWLIVTVIPEADFMAQINANNRATLGLMVVTLGVVIMASIIITRKIIKPILQLNVAAEALANGQWGQTIQRDTRIKEISALTRSFNHMDRQLERTVTGLTYEIAERKRAEVAREAALEQFKALIGNLQMGVLVESKERHIIHTNQTFCSLFGIPAPEMILNADCDAAAQSAAPLFEDSARFIERIEHILSAGAVVVNEELALKDGRTFERDYVPIFLEDDFTGNMWIYRNITGRKQMEQQLVQQERLAAVGQLSAGIAHDFNNLLTGILGFTELLQMSKDTPESLQFMLHNISASSQHAAHLVRQLLDFSRKSIRQTRKLDLATVVSETIRFLERTIPENIRFNLTINPGSYDIEADPAQLQQVITNLALNARDAMPRGGEIQVSLSRPENLAGIFCNVCHQPITGGWVQLSVTDTGSGITPDVLPRIFEPFFTTKAVGKGSGLGLSQVTGIVAQHRGHTRVESQVGQGTTFTIYLPPFLSKDNIPEPPPAAIALGQGETILLVEDEPAVLASTTAMLEYLNYKIIPVSKGQDAIATFEQHRHEIDLVLSDMMMLDIDGEALFHQLKAKDSNLKMVLMSGYPLGEKGATLLAQGLAAWFQKPMSIKQLSLVINNALKV